MPKKTQTIFIQLKRITGGLTWLKSHIKASSSCGYTGTNLAKNIINHATSFKHQDSCAQCKSKCKNSICEFLLAHDDRRAATTLRCWCYPTITKTLNAKQNNLIWVYMLCGVSDGKQQESIKRFLPITRVEKARVLYRWIWVYGIANEEMRHRVIVLTESKTNYIQRLLWQSYWIGLMSKQ